jgi:hypothetical protein
MQSRLQLQATASSGPWGGPELCEERCLSLGGVSSEAIARRSNDRSNDLNWQTVERQERKLLPMQAEELALVGGVDRAHCEHDSAKGRFRFSCYFFSISGLNTGVNVWFFAIQSKTSNQRH